MSDLTNIVSYALMALKVIQTNDRHMPDLWAIVKGYPDYFADDINIKTLSGFSEWHKTLVDSLICYKDGELIGFTHINTIHKGFGVIGICFKRKSITSKEKFLLAKKYLPYLFIKHNLKMLYGIVAVTNTASIRLLKALGFKATEIMKNHAKFNGKDTDCIMAGLIREAVI